jgi:hypothetical protein
MGKAVDENEAAFSGGRVVLRSNATMLPNSSEGVNAGVSRPLHRCSASGFTLDPTGKSAHH